MYYLSFLLFRATRPCRVASFDKPLKINRLRRRQKQSPPNHRVHRQRIGALTETDKLPGKTLTRFDSFRRSGQTAGKPRSPIRNLYRRFCGQVAGLPKKPGSGRTCSGNRVLVRRVEKCHADRQGEDPKTTGPARVRHARTNSTGDERPPPARYAVKEQGLPKPTPKPPKSKSFKPNGGGTPSN